MVLSVLNSDPSLPTNTRNRSQDSLTPSEKYKMSHIRSRAHIVPGGIRHLSDSKRRRRRFSIHSNPARLPSRKISRSTRRPRRGGNTTVDPAASSSVASETQRPQRHTSVPTSVTFPRRLPDLPRKQISAEVLASLGFMSDVPVQYIREKMERLSPNMYQVLRLTKATASGTMLPRTIPITVSCPTSYSLPTHMAAVYSSAPSSSENRKVTLYPLHQSILALYCGNLPVLPPSTPPTMTECPFEVPIVTLALPDPESFPRLIQFLYFKDAQPLLQAFLCMVPDNGIPDDLEQPERYHAFATEYATILAQNYTMHRLANQATKVQGFWRNASALGISDIELQAFFDLAWEVLMKAMIQSAGNNAPVTVST